MYWCVAWQVSNSSVATIDHMSGLLKGNALGAVEVFAEDMRVSGGGDSAIVYVVTPSKLHLEVGAL